jgi:hypothetical protein
LAHLKRTICIERSKVLYSPGGRRYSTPLFLCVIQKIENKEPLLGIDFKFQPWDLGNPRKCAQTAGDFIRDSKGLAGHPQDILGRFSGTFQTDFQGCSEQIWGYSGHVSSVLTMDIDDWTI